MKRLLLAYFEAINHFYFQIPIRNQKFADVSRKHKSGTLVENVFIFFDFKFEEHLFQSKRW